MRFIEDLCLTSVDRQALVKLSDADCFAATSRRNLPGYLLVLKARRATRSEHRESDRRYRHGP